MQSEDGYRGGCGGARVVVAIFGCVLLLITRWNPSLVIKGRTGSVSERLIWESVGMVEVTESESESFVAVSSRSVGLGTYLVGKPMVEMNFRR